MQKGITRMAYYDSNQHTFTQKRNNQPTIIYVAFFFKRKAQIIKHNKKKNAKLWAEDDSYLDEMKGMKKIWRKCALRWLDAAAKWCALWVLSDEAFEFWRKMGWNLISPPFFHPFFYARYYSSSIFLKRYSSLSIFLMLLYHVIFFFYFSMKFCKNWVL